MIPAVMTEAQPHPVNYRETLRSSLEAARVRFYSLLDSFSEEQWRSRSLASKWSVAEVFEHLTWALEYLPKEVDSARRGKGMFNFPKWLADPGSYWYVRFVARNSTREAIRRRYNAAMDAAVKALELVPDTDWELGAAFYGEGFHTVADLFKAPAKHLAEHTAGI